MKELPLVSIIMVVYNSSEFLNEAIESVLQSTYGNLEVIILDDCSTDNSWEIIKSYNNDTIRSYRNSKNLGEYKNRKYGISLCKGKYFLFVDGDDTLLPDGLRENVEILMDNDSAVMGIVRPPDENIPAGTVLTPIESLKKHYLYISPLNLSFARNIFKTSILVQEMDSIPINLYSGDDFIRLYLSSKYNIVILKIPFALWRSRPNQASRNKDKIIDGFLEGYKINNYFLIDENCPLDESDKMLATKKLKKRILIHGLVLLKKGQYLFGLKLLSTLISIRKTLVLKPIYNH